MKLIFQYIITLVFILLMAISCKEDDNPDVYDLEYWLGKYEVDTIDGQAVDCNIVYLQPELITITDDFRFSVNSRCDGEDVLTKGYYEFENGVFFLFVDWIVSEPDVPEFEMQILQDRENNVRIYRCSPSSGSCELRIGTRIS